MLKNVAPKCYTYGTSSIAPAHMSRISLSTFAFGPPAITIGTGQLFITFLKESM